MSENKQSTNKYEQRKAEKQKKKDKKKPQSVSLPNARRSIRRQREMAQGRANYEDTFKLVGVIASVLLVLFLLLGGINQRKFLTTIIDIGMGWGEKVGNLIGENQVEITEDGVYLEGHAPNSEQTEETETEETSEQVQEDNNEEEQNKEGN